MGKHSGILSSSITQSCTCYLLEEPIILTSAVLLNSAECGNGASCWSNKQLSLTCINYCSLICEILIGDRWAAGVSSHTGKVGKARLCKRGQASQHDPFLVCMLRSNVRLNTKASDLSYTSLSNASLAQIEYVIKSMNAWRLLCILFSTGLPETMLLTFSTKVHSQGVLFTLSYYSMISMLSVMRKSYLNLSYEFNCNLLKLSRLD